MKIFRLTNSAPTSFFELRRGLAVALRAEADKATAEGGNLMLALAACAG
jgi:hypothetical protein